MIKASFEPRAATLEIAVHRLCKPKCIIGKVNLRSNLSRKPKCTPLTKETYKSEHARQAVQIAETGALKHLMYDSDLSHHHTWLLNNLFTMWAVTTPNCVVLTATFGHADGIFSTAGVLLLQAFLFCTAYCTEHLHFKTMHHLSSTLYLSSPVSPV